MFDRRHLGDAGGETVIIKATSSGFYASALEFRSDQTKVPHELTGLTTLAMLLLAASPLSAHGEYRTIGTVSKITATQVDVQQTKDATIITINIDQQTTITRDKNLWRRAY